MAEGDVKVLFMPSGRRGFFPRGTPLLDAARSLGVDIDSVCGGRGLCGRCQISCVTGSFAKHQIESDVDHLSPFSATEEKFEERKGPLKEGRRLSCHTTLLDDAVIDVPAESQVHRQIVRKEMESRDIRLDTATRLYYVQIAEPSLEDPRGEMQFLFEALEREWGVAGLTLANSQLHALQAALTREDRGVTVAVYQEHLITGIWPGLFDQPRGIAIDVGSTTVAAHLCDLNSGDVLASAGVMNPQIRYGEDLMSRVSYAMMQEGGASEMTRAVREAINTLAGQIAEDAGIDPKLILETVFVCNPVMHHLLLGIDPVELGQAPFALATSDALRLSAPDLGLSTLNPQAQIYLLPCIAGHVGADAAAVALSEAPEQSEDLVLIVDVGTNAEILLGNKTKVLACSSPTGPAFEGAQISSGQRAAPGAIEHIEIDPATKEPRFRVIGCDLWSDEAGFAEATAQTGMTGICGSGIIEAVAEMRAAGLLDRSGLIGSAEQTGTPRSIPTGRTHEYLIFDGTATGGPRITVTQGDIRAIQLAKSALYAGARLLMDQMNVDAVDRVVLAGAFGAHISPKHAMILGMIPDAPLEKVTSAGNAAGHGARIALCNRAARKRIEGGVRAIQKVETAIEPRFQEHFVAANAIPHKTAAMPHLETVVSLPDVNFGASGGGGNDDGRRRRRRG